MIVIYGQPGCGWCEKAIDLCGARSLEYEYRSIANDHYKKELKEKFPDVKTVPQVYWHGRHIGGYEQFATEVENTVGGYGESNF